jgi:hypothetical protein
MQRLAVKGMDMGSVFFVRESMLSCFGLNRRWEIECLEECSCRPTFVRAVRLDLLLQLLLKYSGEEQAGLVSKVRIDSKLMAGSKVEDLGQAREFSLVVTKHVSSRTISGVHVVALSIIDTSLYFEYTAINEWADLSCSLNYSLNYCTV